MGSPYDLKINGLTIEKSENESFVEIEIQPFTVPGNTYYFISATAFLTVGSNILYSQDIVKLSILPS